MFGFNTICSMFSFSDWQIIQENLRWKYSDPDELDAIYPKKPLFHRNNTISNQMGKRPKLPTCLWSTIERKFSHLYRTKFLIKQCYVDKNIIRSLLIHHSVVHPWIVSCTIEFLSGHFLSSIFSFYFIITNSSKGQFVTWFWCFIFSTTLPWN